MIDIVLATYNGERFLAEQIKSIQRNDSYHEKIARLIVIDDGSTDNTSSIVKSLATVDPKIEWHVNSSELHGASNNFAAGISLTTADYVMLCDQDDIWLPEKIETSLSSILKLSSSDHTQPCLVFSDKLIVNEELTLLCNSYFTLKNIPKNWYMKFEQLCQQNVASGCTMLFNRQLINLALPIPEKAYMHDWWLILVASRCGQVKLIEQPLIKYRQHGNNSIGATKISKWHLLSSFRQYLAKFEQSFLKTVEQAQAFKVFEQRHHLIENHTINKLANIKGTSRTARVKLFLNKTVTRSHFLGKAALLLVLLKMKVETVKY